jgi:chromosomal replication initiation ATPase DnaA
MIKLICALFKVSKNSIRRYQAGKHHSNPVRSFAMYVCRHYGDNSQKKIADAFELSHPGSSSFPIDKIKKEVSKGQWKPEIEWLEKRLGIVKSA